MKDFNLTLVLLNLDIHYFANSVDPDQLASEELFAIKNVNLYQQSGSSKGVVGWCEGAVYLTSLGRPTDIGLQLGKACYPCSG